MNTSEVKFIRLPNGNTLEVSIYPGFLQKVKDHFCLDSLDAIDDEHVKMYIYYAFKGAIDGQENGTI